MYKIKKVSRNFGALFLLNCIIFSTKCKLDFIYASKMYKRQLVLLDSLLKHIFNTKFQIVITSVSSGNHYKFCAAGLYKNGWETINL